MSEDIWSQIEKEIIDQYLNDENPRPWIIAFSGGKDSTTVLQLVWNSLKKIEPDILPLDPPARNHGKRL